MSRSMLAPAARAVRLGAGRGARSVDGGFRAEKGRNVCRQVVGGKAINEAMAFIPPNVSGGAISQGDNSRALQRQCKKKLATETWSQYTIGQESSNDVKFPGRGANNRRAFNYVTGVMGSVPFRVQSGFF